QDMSMLPVVDPVALSRPQSGLRGRNVGAVLVVAAFCMVPAIWQQRSTSWCLGQELLGTPAGVLLLAAIVASGVALLFGLPRCSAVAPALASGAALILLGAAGAGWMSVSGHRCGAAGLSSPAVLLVVQSGGAIAILGAAIGLLYARDEFEPWGGAQGVVASGAAAVTMLVVGGGFAVLIAGPAGFSAVGVLVAVALPWSISIGATGWLRRSPAIASMVCVACQAVWLLVEFT
ncbi:MAG: hypothetical protein ABI586_11605, partial [Candidatus Nanopelagicales bacterium]